jgi:hypothetical protein
MFQESIAYDAGGWPVSDKPRPSRAELARTQYAARKEAGQCVKCGRPAAADSLWCSRHRGPALEQARAAAKQRRRDRRSHGNCGECGLPKEARKRGRPVVQKTVIPPLPISPHSSHAARVAAATRHQYEAGAATYNGGTRTRYAGRGKRGGIGNAANDELDLGIAAKELEGARQQLLAAHALPAGIEKREQVRAAVGKLQLAQRVIDAVAARRLR